MRPIDERLTDFNGRKFRRYTVRKDRERLFAVRQTPGGLSSPTLTATAGRGSRHGNTCGRIDDSNR